MADRLHSAQLVINEVEKAVVGKRDILTKIMTAILAGGHILIEDIPGQVRQQWRLHSQRLWDSRPGVCSLLRMCSRRI